MFLFRFAVEEPTVEFVTNSPFPDFERPHLACFAKNLPIIKSKTPPSKTDTFTCFIFQYISPSSLTIMLSPRSEHSACHDAPSTETKSSKRRPRSTNSSSVSFSPAVTVHTFQNVPDARVIWYNQDEYIKMKKHTEKSVKKLEEGKLVESSKECLEGLGGLSCQGVHMKMQRQAESRQAVLREQRYQRNEGLTDASRIAEAYSNSCSSTNCQTEAVMTAMRMETGVKRDHSQSPPAPSNRKSPVRGFLDRSFSYAGR
jgi:hypothetical protein